MRTFIAGLVVGAATVAALWWIVALGAQVPDPEPAPTAPAEPPRRTERDTPTVAAPQRASRPRADPPAVSDAAPFPPGEFTLRIGEGYRFGDSTALARGAAGADVTCLDIAGDTTMLRCAAGGRAADIPLGAVGVPSSPAAAAALLADAPDDLAPGNLALGVRIQSRRPGLGMVRDAAGSAFRLWVIALDHDPDALRRAVRVGYAKVPVTKGGGVLGVTVATKAGDAPTLRDLDAIMAAGDAIPHASFANFLQGDYERIAAPPPDLVLDERKYLLFDEPLSTTIEFKRYSGLVAARGIAAAGKVRIRSYTGVAVRGEMAGEIDVGSYAYVHISGDLTGKLLIRSYATVVIDGDLRGEVDASSYVTILLRGRLTGKLKINSSNSHFWFQQWMARATAEALEGRGNELHLRESDLADGTYDDVTGWKKTYVGEEAWNVIAR